MNINVNLTNSNIETKVSIDSSAHTKVERSDTLSQGAKLEGTLISVKDNVITFSHNGKVFSANINSIPLGAKFIAEVLKTTPMLELKLLPTTLDIIKKDASLFLKEDVAKLFKGLAAVKLLEIAPNEIKRVIKDGGNFFENKLLKGLNVKEDAKFEGYAKEDVKSGINKMQSTNLLLENELFTFFEAEHLDFDDGVMRFKKGDSGELSLFMKVNFTNLGLTIISFTPSKFDDYNVIIKTEKDITEGLSDLDFGKLKVRWQKLIKKDAKLFEISHEQLQKIIKFDTVV